MPRPLPAHILEATGGDAAAVRDHLLAAAHRVIRDQGLAAASTRAIAIEAEVGAGTLYNYFDDRLHLVAQAILHHTHELAHPMAAFPERAGRGTVAGNLRYFAKLADAVMVEVVPLMAAAFADTELLATLRREMAKGDPASMGAAVLVTYLHGERDLGRISPDADCEAAAALVVSVCHDHAFHRYLRGHPGPARVPAKALNFIAAALIPELCM